MDFTYKRWLMLPCLIKLGLGGGEVTLKWNENKNVWDVCSSVGRDHLMMTL